MARIFKVAIVEQHEFHYEMVLPVLQPLVEMGCQFTIYYEGNDLGLRDFSKKYMKIDYMPREPKRIFEEFEEYDLVVVLTFPCYHESDWIKCGCFKRILNLPVPKILFAHFPEILPDHRILNMIDSSNTYVFHVAPHGYKWFLEKDGSDLFESYFYFPVFRMPDSFTKHTNQICITGQINYYRRDYHAVLKALSGLVDKLDLRLVIIGRCYDNQIDRLRDEIKQFSLQDHVFVNSFATYSDFYEVVQSSLFTLTAIEPTKDRYYTNALTASITASISCSTSVIVDERLYSLYDNINKTCLLVDPRLEKLLENMKMEMESSSRSMCVAQSLNAIIAKNKITLEHIFTKVGDWSCKANSV